ncbi:MAG: hypothetical protein GTN36_01330 [Candidatus Aenigmarchaeota archaeon]|nr:hypothetical protein [Candidatus Aenigmarchaeota archaeon]
MRAVTPVMSGIIIISLTIALMALFWIFISGSYTYLTSSGESTVARTLLVVSSCMKIESVSGNKVYVKNCGEGSITEDTLKVFLNDIPLNFTMSPTIVEEDEVGTVRLSGLLNFSLGGYLLKVTNPKVITERTVEAVLHDSCVLAFDFDEGSGTKVHDSSGYENDGTIYGTGISWTNGKFGSALDFPGTDERYVNVSDSPSLDITDEITIEAWIYPEWVGTTSSPYIVAKNYGYPDGTRTYAFFLHYQPPGQVTGVLNETTIDGIIININQWYHVAMSWDGSIAKIYLNGEKTNETSFTGPLTPNDYRLVVGARNDGGTPPTLNTHRQFNGTIDNLRIYNKALTPDELVFFKPVKYY